MEDRFVTVARFSLPTEAQVVAGKLREAGVRTILCGDLTATTLMLTSLGAQVELQVPADQLKLALDVLSSLGHGGEPEEGEWEDEPGLEEGVWVCTLCGSPVEEGHTTCPDCGTPREAVKSASSDLTDLPRRTSAASEPPSERVRKPGEVTGQRPPQEVPPELGDEVEVPATDNFLADDLARRAVIAAVLSCLVPLVVIYSLWLQLRLCLFPGTLSTKASWYLFLAFVINLFVLAWCFFWVALIRFYADL